MAFQAVNISESIMNLENKSPELIVIQIQKLTDRLQQIRIEESSTIDFTREMRLQMAVLRRQSARVKYQTLVRSA